MKRRQFTAALPALCGLGTWATARAQPSQSDAAAAIRIALERGAVAAVGLLGRTDGFLGNPKVRIPLPKSLESAGKLARATGQGRAFDDLVTGMNRAAEAAVPEAKALLVDAAKSITADDAMRIVRGGDTSVTDYFAGRTRAPLTQKFLPIVTRATEKYSLAAQYNQLAGQAAGFGLVKKDEASIEQYVTAKALDGLYTMIGEEERKLRADPMKAGSDLLRRVFGG
jgi:hypothetical protein